MQLKLPKFFIVLALLAGTPTGYAEQPKITIPNLLCGEFSEFSKMIEAYGEKPVFYGKSERTIGQKKQQIDVFLTVNLETGTWTYAEILPDKSVCIIDMGNGGHIKMPASAAKLQS
mgnify:CR=1 FL=1